MEYMIVSLKNKVDQIYKNKNTILLNEVHINKYDNICVVTLDKFNHIALTHFAWSNKIPRNFNY